MILLDVFTRVFIPTEVLARCTGMQCVQIESYNNFHSYVLGYEGVIALV